MVNGSDQVQVDKSTGFQVSPSITKLRFRSFNMPSPRSSNYDRLEGGLGPSGRMTKKFAWKKFAIAAGVLVAFVYFFGPRANKTMEDTNTAETYGPSRQVLLSSCSEVFLMNRLVRNNS
jgi:hypothetical protein